MTKLLLTLLHRVPRDGECSDVGVQPGGDVGCFAFKFAIAAKILSRFFLGATAVVSDGRFGDIVQAVVPAQKGHLLENRTFPPLV